MRISDWSSDVCSSDLGKCEKQRGNAERGEKARGQPLEKKHELCKRTLQRDATCKCRVGLEGPFRRQAHTDRKSVVSGKSVSVRVDLGGRRIIKKKKNTT